MQVYLQALGCRLNEAELEAWSRDWRAQGHAICRRAEDADIVVINSCAVTAESVRKSRQLMRRARRTNPMAKLVVSGCYASLGADGGEMDPADLGVDLVVPNTDKDRLVQIATEALALPAMPAAATDPDEQSPFARGRQRAFIKVQDGCRYRCSYCIVTRARGAERSKPVADVIDEINRQQADGINEVVLAGVHLGGYGSDLGTSLATLVSAALSDTDMPRIRLGSLEPWELHDDFWALFADPRLMPHLHLPIQSGADSVLRRMARRCRTSDFRRLVGEARCAVPGFNVTTDVIVGFPGETEAEWRQTLDFVASTDFGHVHIFPYSPRSGTKAATLPDQVSREVKRQRSERLHDVARRGSRRVLEGSAGTRQAVLFEQRDGNVEASRSTWLGYTPNYLRVEVETAPDDDYRNRIVETDIIGLSDAEDRLKGTPAC